MAKRVRRARNVTPRPRRRRTHPRPVELHAEVIRAQADAAEARAQQTATAEILKVLSRSPNDVAPVFEAILDRAIGLCDAQLGFAFRCDGQAFDLVAQRGLDAERLPAVMAALLANRVPGPRTALGHILSKRRMVHVPDVMTTNAYRTRDPQRASCRP